MCWESGAHVCQRPGPSCAFEDRVGAVPSQRCVAQGGPSIAHNALLDAPRDGYVEDGAIRHADFRERTKRLRRPGNEYCARRRRGNAAQASCSHVSNAYERVCADQVMVATRAVVGSEAALGFCPIRMPPWRGGRSGQRVCRTFVGFGLIRWPSRPRFVIEGRACVTICVP